MLRSWELASARPNVYCSCIMSAQLSDILQLSIAERIQLAEDIWDSIATTPDALPLTDAARQELDRRLASHAAHPEEGIAWDDLKQKVRRSA